MSIHIVVEPPTIIYYHRLYGLCRGIVRMCDEVFGETAEATGREHYLRAAPELHAKIDGILAAASNVKRLLKMGTQLRRETPATLEFRKRRVEVLAGVTAPLGLEAIMSTTARDTIEHFDEHLDRQIVAAREHPNPQRSFAAYNMVVTQDEMYPIRVYNAVTRTYRNLDASIDLDKLRAEAASIIVRLDDLNVLGSAQESGALILPFDRI